MIDEPDESLGSAAEEAARLADALHGWWSARGEAAGPGAPPSGPPPGRPHEPGRPHHAECRVCPVCRGIAALRSVRPEVIEHLASAAESVAAALRELAESRPAPAQAPSRSAAGAGERPGTVHIDVQDGDEEASWV